MADDTGTTDTTTAPQDGSANSSAADAGDDKEAYFRAEIKKIAAERDSWKSQAREKEKAASAASKAEAAKLAEAGEWQRLAETQQAKLDEMQGALGDYESLKARESERLEAVRADADKLRGKVPKGIRESLPQGLDPDQELRLIRALVETHTNKGAAPAPAAAGKSSSIDIFATGDAGVRKKAIAEMSSDERRALQAKLIAGMRPGA